MAAKTFANVHPPPPLKLDDKPVEEWKLFKQLYENYGILTELEKQNKKYQKAAFLNCAGPEGVKIYNSLTFKTAVGEAGTDDYIPAEDADDVTIIIQKFEKHIVGETNETFERYRFNKRDQMESETTEQYVAVLRDLRKTCNFCDCMKDSLLRDRIILGVKDAYAQKLMLQKQGRNLTLNDAIDICRATEATKTQLKDIGENQNVHKVTHRQKPTTGAAMKNQGLRPNKPKLPTLSPQIITCKYCGGQHERKKELCPAWGKRCSKCKKLNHFASSCLSRREVHLVEDEYDSLAQYHEYTQENSSEYAEYVMSVVDVQVNSVKEDNKKGPLYAQMLMGKAKLKLQIDCGATVNVLPVKHIDLTHNKLEESDITLKMWNNSTKDVMGKTRVVLRNPKNRRYYSVEFQVVDSEFTPLLSRRAAEQMKLITVNYQNFKQLHSITTNTPPEEEFKDVFEDKLGTFPGEVHLKVNKNVKPVKCPLRTVPQATKPLMKKELDRLVKIGAIAPITEPTDWVSQASFPKKKDGSHRLCIDPGPLNKALEREAYHLPILEEMLPELAKAKVLSKLDLRSGYWHCKLDHESSLLTTFITPFGRYRWLRLPFGLNVSSEIFQRKLLEVLEGLKGIICIADDVLVDGDDDSDHDQNLRGLLQRGRDNGISFNRTKCKFRLPEVDFMGHVVTTSGLKPDPKKIDAVLNMQRPMDHKAIQRLQGTVGYLAKFLPRLSAVMEPIRRLAQEDEEWQWTEVEEEAFEEIKRLATQAPVLGYFDTHKPLIIECDASEGGLGAALIQDDHPVAYASRALRPEETRYAQIEKECLAIVYSLERFHQFTFGRKVMVYSDHKPLEAIVKKPLYRAPRRLQGMLLRMLNYDVDIVWKKGKHMYISDMLSRAYLPYDGKGDQFEIVNAVEHLPISPEKLAELKAETERDETLQLLAKVISKGWPEEKESLPMSLHVYFSTRDEYVVQNGLIFRGERVVVPESMRAETKDLLHRSHLGVESTLRRARECLYWPNMTSDIKQVVEQCGTCRTYERAHQNETLMSHEIPSRQYEKVAADLFALDGTDYQILVDYYSNFWEIDRLYSIKTGAIIKKMKAHFARYGIPSTVVTDPGTQYDNREFREFAKNWGFTHVMNSPKNSKANGKAESAVKAAKSMLRKCKLSQSDPYMALLEIRNTPQQGMESSPAQRLHSRRTRTLLPTTAKLLAPRGESYLEFDKRKIQEQKNAQAKQFNKTAKDLPCLEEGDIVRMQPFRLGKKEWDKATVVRRLDQRSYEVETPSGVYRRNRVHLRKTKEPPPQMSPSTYTGEKPMLEIPKLQTHIKQKLDYHNNQSVSAESSIPEPGMPVIEPQPHLNNPSTPPPLTSACRPKRQVKLPAKLKDFIVTNK